MPTPTQEDSSFKRKLSKREKKELKKAEKKEKVKEGKGDESMADKLYTGQSSVLGGEQINFIYFPFYSVFCVSPECTAMMDGGFTLF